MEGKYQPQKLVRKECAELGATVSLTLRMCEPIFVTGEAVVLDCGFCTEKGITKTESKGIYSGALIKNRHYWPKGVPGYLIDTHFQYKEVDSVNMIGSIIQYNKPFRIFCMIDLDYVMNIISSWMVLDELEGAKTRKYFMGISGMNKTKILTYRHPFGLHFKCIYQGPHMAKGLNLIFWYKFMVFTLVPLRTSKILIIFWMGYINVYMVHTVAPQRLVSFIPTILDNGQIFSLSLTVW